MDFDALNCFQTQYPSRKESYLSKKQRQKIILEKKKKKKGKTTDESCKFTVRSTIVTTRNLNTLLFFIIGLYGFRKMQLFVAVVSALCCLSWVRGRYVPFPPHYLMSSHINGQIRRILAFECVHEVSLCMPLDLSYASEVFW